MKNVLELANKIHIYKKLNIVDCDSNIGLFSLWLSKYKSINKILSIEADKENFEFQSRYNKLINTELIHAAMWSNNHEKLTISSRFRGGEHCRSIAN